MGDCVRPCSVEYKFIEAIFIAPKVYGGSFIKDNKINEISKIKGYKNQVDFKILKTLLKKNRHLELNNEKWFRNVYKGNIEIKKQIYNLIITSNKRKIKYLNNIFVGTEPYIINENKDISNKND